MTSPRKPRHPRSMGREAPRRRSRRVKMIVTGGNAAASSLGGDPLSVVDFDQSEWEIMYPCFVESGLVDPPNYADN
jgi:hypothetical protein